ncbi:alpha/beta hydrolase fold-1 [Tanacetum coccineum]
MMYWVQEMNKEHVEEKRELIIALAKDRKLSEIPKISQPTKIIWGDKDQVFPLELGYRLKRHLGDNADMVVIKGTGHAYLVEKPKEFYRHLKSFLIPEVPPIPSITTPHTAATPTITNAPTNNHDLHSHNNGSVTVAT